MSGNVPSPAERLQAAARMQRLLAGLPIIDAEFDELVAVLLEGMAAHWATRPIADWNDYAITPLAALERHINGEETSEQ